MEKLEKEHATQRAENSRLDEPLSEEELGEREEREKQALIDKVHRDSIGAIPPLDQKEIDGQINVILDADRAKHVATRKDMGRAEMLIFRARKLGETRFHRLFRELLGEYKHPIVNLMRTVQRQSTVLAGVEAQRTLAKINERMHKDYDAGKKKGVFAPHPWFIKADGPQGEYYKPIDNIPEMGPLAGAWATPEFAEAMKDAFGISGLVESDDFMYRTARFVGKILGTAKKSQTTLSQQTHMRNFTANTGIAFAQGHLSASRTLWDAVRLSGIYLTKTGKDAEIDGVSARDLVQRLVNGGVLNETVVVQDIANMVQQHAHKTGLEVAAMEPDYTGLVGKLKGVFKKVVRGVKKVDYALSGLYEMGDAYWKINGWLLERKLGMHVIPEGTVDREQKLDDYASKRIRNMYPTYSNTPEFIRFIRWFPLVGSFPTYTSDFIRTQWYRTPKIFLADMKSSNKRVRARGTATAVRWTLMNALAGEAVAALVVLMLRLLDDEDWRRMTPEAVSYTHLTLPTKRIV